VNMINLTKRGARKALAVIAALTLLMAFLPVAPASAAAALTVSPSTVTAGQSATYSLTLTGLNTHSAAINSQNITVTFPSNFSLSNSEGAQITAVSNGQPYVIKPTVTAVYNVVTLAVPNNAVPDAVTDLTISGLTMTAPSSAGTGQVMVQLADFNSASASLTVQAAPTQYTVTITGPTSPVTAGQDFNVTGTISPAHNGKTVTVSIKQNNTVVASKTATTAKIGDVNGSFSADSFNLTTAGNYTIEASCEGGTPSTASLTVNPAAAAKLVFVNPPSSLLKGQTVSFTVYRADQYNNLVTSGSTVVYLSAVQNSQAAGYFKDGSAIVSSVTIPNESSSKQFTFTPTVAGSVTVTASSSGLASATYSTTVPAVPTTATLSFNPGQVTGDGKVVVDAQNNTTIQATITLNQPADQDYNVAVTLTPSSGGGWASAPTSVTISKGQLSTTFNITVTSGAAGKTLTVTASFTNNEGTTVATSGSLSFVSSAAQYSRTLSTGWQVISVPVKLTKSLADMIGASNIEVIYLYDAASNSWKQFSSMNADEQYGKPLVGYLVKMKASVTAQAAYQPVSATQAVPPTLALKTGWNLVGASGDKLADVLASVKGKYSTVVSPGLGNRQNDWSAVTSESIAADTSAAVGDAYWVYMTADGTLAGLIAPPIQ